MSVSKPQFAAHHSIWTVPHYYKGLMSVGFRLFEVCILSGWIVMGHGGKSLKTSPVERNTLYY